MAFGQETNYPDSENLMARKAFVETSMNGPKAPWTAKPIGGTPGKDESDKSYSFSAMKKRAGM